MDIQSLMSMTIIINLYRKLSINMEFVQCNAIRYAKIGTIVKIEGSRTAPKLAVLRLSLDDGHIGDNICGSDP